MTPLTGLLAAGAAVLATGGVVAGAVILRTSGPLAAGDSPKLTARATSGAEAVSPSPITTPSTAGAASPSPMARPTGQVATITGGPTLHGPPRDGPPGVARFGSPDGIAAGPDGSLYVADFENRVIVRLDSAGNTTIVAGSGEQGIQDGPAEKAQFYGPASLTVAEDGTIYVADSAAHRIRRISPGGDVSTLAGGGDVGLNGGSFRDGRGAEARFDLPGGLIIDQDGSLLVADKNNNRIRRVTADGIVTTAAGTGEYGHRDGAAQQARFGYPVALALGPDGSLYVTEHGNNDIRRLTPEGVLETIVPYSPGGLPGALLSWPSGVAVSPNGEVFVADTQGNRILLLTAAGPMTIAGTGLAGFADGPAAAAVLNMPVGILVSGGNVIFTEINNAAIRMVVR